MEAQFKAALPIALLAFVGVELASLLNISSTAGRVAAGVAGALGGVLLAQKL